MSLNVWPMSSRSCVQNDRDWSATILCQPPHLFISLFPSTAHFNREHIEMTSAENIGFGTIFSVRHRQFCERQLIDIPFFLFRQRKHLQFYFFTLFARISSSRFLFRSRRPESTKISLHERLPIKHPPVGNITNHFLLSIDRTGS